MPFSSKRLFCLWLEALICESSRNSFAKLYNDAGCQTIMRPCLVKLELILSLIGFPTSTAFLQSVCVYHQFENITIPFDIFLKMNIVLQLHFVKCFFFLAMYTNLLNSGTNFCIFVNHEQICLQITLLFLENLERC